MAELQDLLEIICCSGFKISGHVLISTPGPLLVIIISVPEMLFP